jgi:hypothetical protein
VHAGMVLVVPPVAIVLACGLYDSARACLTRRDGKRGPVVR